jgi:serine/threonine-protein kinase
MAPEQAKGAKDIDTRVDIYAAGVILYEAVSGQVPFNADTFNELIFKIVLESPPPVEQVAPGLDPGFAAIISKAMARDLTERYASCADFLAALNAWAQNHVSQAPHAGAMHQASHHQASPHQTPHAAAPGTGPRAAAASAVDVRTKGAWSNTQGEAALTPAPAKKKTGLVVGIAAGLVVVLAGGAFTAYKVTSDSQQAAAAAAAQAEKDRLAAEHKAQQELLRLEEERKRAIAERADAEARAQSEKARAEEQGKALELAKQAAATSEGQASAKPVAPVPRPRTTAPAAPKPETTSKPKPGTRQIRTSL